MQIRLDLDWDGIAVLLPTLRGKPLRDDVCLEVEPVEAFTENARAHVATSGLASASLPSPP